MQIVNHEIQLIQCPTDFIPEIIEAARTCYKSWDKSTSDSDEALVKSLKRSDHNAMFEFVSIKFRVQTDRGVSHEFVRHRLASYAQESTRYVDFTKHGLDFIKPIKLKEHYVYWEVCMSTCEEVYKAMRNIGIKAETARSVLPNSLKTEFVVKMNLRELLHFFDMRTSKAAHPDMRYVAKLMLDALKEHITEFCYELFFQDFEERYKD